MFGIKRYELFKRVQLLENNYALTKNSPSTLFTCNLSDRDRPKSERLIRI